MEAFTAAGVNVYTLSYDEQDALADFRDAYGITFTMLSDPDSKVIREFGILNTLIKEDDHPWFGVPFPGAYVIDKAGVISHKFFGNNLALRVGPETLLRAAQGQAIAPPAAEHESPNETTWNVSLDGEELVVSVLRDLVARIEVPAGRYLHAAPAPTDRVAVELLLKEHPRVVIGDVSIPESISLTLKGTGTVVPVYRGVAELRVPLAANANLASATISLQQEITLIGELVWQSCDDEVSDPPRRERFELKMSVAPSVVSELSTPVDGVVVRSMNGMKHFERLAQRRDISDISKLFPE